MGTSEERDNTPQNLRAPIETLGLSRRPKNCLDKAGIRTVGELVQRTEGELLRLQNMGQKSVKEIRATLDLHVLHLGMRF